MRVLIVEPGLSPREAVIGKDLKSMQGVVGGWIEPVSPPFHKDDAIIVCNDEGKIAGLPLNQPIRLEDGSIYDVIAGTFFICRAPEDSEDFESLTDEQIDIYKRMYAW